MAITFYTTNKRGRLKERLRLHPVSYGPTTMSKTAFHYETYYHLTQVIKKMASRMAAIDPMELNEEEFLDMFVPAQSRERWRDFSVQFQRGPYYRTADFNMELPTRSTGENFQNLRYPAALVVTSEVLLVPQPPKPLLLAHVREWAIRALQVGVNFGMALKVLELLNDKCTNPGQVRYYWPCILTIASELTDEHALSNELSHPNNRRAPALTPTLREACRLTSGFITQASLVELPTREKKKPEAEVSFNSYNQNTIMSDIGSFQPLF